MTTFEGPPLDSTPGIGALTLGGFLRDVAAAHGPREASWRPACRRATRSAS